MSYFLCLVNKILRLYVHLAGVHEVRKQDKPG
jgi:hypothetical protein